jgi:hypothetical protein
LREVVDFATNQELLIQQKYDRLATSGKGKPWNQFSKEEREAIVEKESQETLKAQQRMIVPGDPTNLYAHPSISVLAQTPAFAAGAPAYNKIVNALVTQGTINKQLKLTPELILGEAERAGLGPEQTAVVIKQMYESADIITAESKNFLRAGIPVAKSHWTKMTFANGNSRAVDLRNPTDVLNFMLENKVTEANARSIQQLRTSRNPELGVTDFGAGAK